MPMIWEINNDCMTGLVRKVSNRLSCVELVGPVRFGNTLE